MGLAPLIDAFLGFGTEVEVFRLFSKLDVVHVLLFPFCVHVLMRWDGDPSLAVLDEVGTSLNFYPPFGHIEVRKSEQMAFHVRLYVNTF